MADIDPVVPFFAGLVIDCADPKTLSHWWAELLGTEVAMEHDEFCVVRPPEGRKTTISFQKVPEGKIVKNRAHPDLGVGDRVAAAARAVEMGATQVAENTWPGGWSWTVMQDPKGNEFCLVQPPDQDASSSDDSEAQEATEDD